MLYMANWTQIVSIKYYCCLQKKDIARAGRGGLNHNFQYSMHSQSFEKEYIYLFAMCLIYWIADSVAAAAKLPMKTLSKEKFTFSQYSATDRRIRQTYSENSFYSLTDWLTDTFVQFWASFNHPFRSTVRYVKRTRKIYCLSYRNWYILVYSAFSSHLA